MNVPLVGFLALSGGDWVIYLLIACSILSLAVIIERAVVLERERKGLELLRQALPSAKASFDPKAIDKLDGLQGSPARVARAALATGREAENISELDEVLSVAAQQERPFLEKRLLILGTLGNNAPFIGLLGTVLGVIKAFHDLAHTDAGPELVMAGLSQALVATATGLLVAIPCVIFFNYLQKKSKDILDETQAHLRGLWLARKRQA